jgi:uncharacterized membrane protein YcjF (UPF0283 family)
MSLDLDDDVRIGLPRPAAHPVPPAPPIPHAAPPEVELRPGETELGRPPQVPATVAPLSVQDQATLRAAAQAEVAAQTAEAEELLASEADLSLPAFVRHPLTALLVLAVGVFGVFVLNQGLATWATVQGLAVPLNWIAGSVLLVFVLAAVYGAARLAWLYLHLTTNRQIRLAGLAELQQRVRLRWLAQTKAAEAKGHVEAYIRLYPNDALAHKRWTKLGGSAAGWQGLELARTALLDAGKTASTPHWFEQFKGDFQGRLDKLAEQRIAYYAKRTALVTALSPNGLVDTLATTYFSFALVGELCQIYQLRAGRVGTAIILARVFFHAYLAGQINELEGVTEQAFEHLFTTTGVLHELAAARLAGKLGAKAASGALNYFLLQRLGRYTTRLLRPVA